ncbi:deleted in malignant brain tumors 1 protein-like [Lytechinus variegatus]|uniref:deleted in malignant brain tumors 1 protein-like n=1 Tax=Lytechinus variegatus TaxID=7654 RepID=UPI001BB13810|nr:deleted in malignant brain tumors 1 protein-like [Lytechinus variegatus]
MLFTTDSSVTDKGFQLRLSAVYAIEDPTTNPPPPGVTDTPISTVRLVNGGGAHEGRVEVYHDGLWGTVCDDFWDMVDARVVCRSLGYSDASSAPRHAHFGYGNDPIWMDNVHCAGYEEHIFDCPHNGFGNHNCNHGEDASVICIPDLRLVNGGGAHEGRVEVYHDGLWGTVCDDFWDMVDAHVVCRSLGYSDASSAPRHAHFGYGNGPIWMDNVHCAGYEEHIFDCPHNGFGNHNCNHGEDASVICIPDREIVKINEEVV